MMRHDIPDTPDYRPPVTMQVYGHGKYMVDADLDGLTRFAALLHSIGSDAGAGSKTVASIEWNLPAAADLLSPGTSASCTASAGIAGLALLKLSIKADLLSSLTASTAQTYSSAEDRSQAHIRQVRIEFDIAMVAFGVGQAWNPEKRPPGISKTTALEGPEIIKWAIQTITESTGGNYTTSMKQIDSAASALFPDRGKLVTTMAAGPDSAKAKAATSIADGAQRITKLYENPENAAHIQVQRSIDPVTHKSTWLILLPGTSTWSLNAKNPDDLTGNLANAAGRASAIEKAAWAALDDAKRRAGDTDNSDPVMIEGHSQGGMAATNMAIHAAQTGRANVTHVVTFGSPVGVQKVPSKTRVLNVQNSEDTVPTLDGIDSGDHDPNRTVIILNDPSSLVQDDGTTSRVQAHDIGQYGRDYAIATSKGPANADITNFEASAAGFFSPKASTYIYDTTRITPPEKHPGLLGRDPKDVR